MKLSKKKFKQYLMKHYNLRFVDKLTALFDFVNSRNYLEFYGQIEEIFLKGAQNIEHKLKSLKAIAFQLYDMNNDNLICEYDLFSVVKNSSDSLFLAAMQQDLMDISQKVKFKQQFSGVLHSSFNESCSLKNNYKINNLDKFLQERKQINEIHNNFLSVFNSPRNAHHSYQQESQPHEGVDQEKVFRYTQVQGALKMKRQLTKHTESSYQTQGLSHISQSQEPPQMQFMQNDQAANGQAAVTAISSSQVSSTKATSRRPSIGHLLKKVQDLYQTEDITTISCDEFCKEVQFKYGIPLILLEFLEYLTGLSFLQRFKKDMAVSSNMNIVESFDDELINMKQQLNDEFYESHILHAFNLIGDYAFKDAKQVNIQQLETKQYLTFNSFKKNMDKLFGSSHDYFAEMFFKFLSGGSTCQRVSIKTYIKKFSNFWPRRKEEEEDPEEKIQNYYSRLQEDKERKRLLNKIAFDFYDNDRDGVLSVLDLIKMESFFEENSEISIEIDKLLEVYKNKNLRPKYVRHQFVLDFDRFHQLIGESCLVKELKYILVDQHLKPQKDYINVFQPNPTIPKKNFDLNERRKLLNYDGIFDKELIQLNNK